MITKCIYLLISHFEPNFNLKEIIISIQKEQDFSEPWEIEIPARL
jgi:hypothetical protein